MATQIQITQADIDDVAKKLDEFAAVLNERERSILLAVVGLAGKAVQDLYEAGTKGAAGAPGPKALPALSAGFRQAFANGVGAKFRIYDPVEAETVRVKGSVDGDWAR